MVFLLWLFGIELKGLIMRHGVSMKEYVEDGKRYVKFNESVCEIHDDIDRGALLFNLLCCSSFLLKKHED